MPLGKIPGLVEVVVTCQLLINGCLRRRMHSITNESSPGCSIMCCCHGITQGHLGVVDDLVSPAEWWPPLGRRHDEGGVEARMLMALVPGCRRQMCPNALRRSLQIVVVRGGSPVRVIIEAFVTWSYQRMPTMRRKAFVLKASGRRAIFV